MGDGPQSLMVTYLQVLQLCFDSDKSGIGIVEHRGEICQTYRRKFFL